ncbi:unnamed protein product [Aureobasidium vineae]|uniref:Uncharacterized protein n=1 Tax=Aureobasidium vineae TaxID=2773715 RepID=A0A9N8PHR8_9PEZI|nr:unnamed protein product [Aureobasidium vineae]
MSDALCGPSNAVQNLAKHSSVDRTLQQDRLVSRQSPDQGFRSYNPNVASLDPEFEAFQNGHAHSLAGPSWAASSLSNFHSQPPSFQSASPLPSASWTQDFNRLSISSPQQPQLQAAPQAWHNHFGQHAQHPAPLNAAPSQIQPPSARFQPPLAFNHMHSAPRYASQSQTLHQQQQQQQLPQDQFDEAAFEAAFDAALQDASMDQDSAIQEHEQPDPFDFDSFLPDIYPHLPLFRLALANALVTNTDESLHRAAKIVDALIKHPQTMDPIQAMLFRPLLSALNDPKRTLFSQRYGYEPALNQMLDGLAQQTENTRLDISASTEQLLASYADLLWQRTESNHLQPTNIPRAADNSYWLENFFREQDSVPAQNITQQSARLLTKGFNRQVISDTHSQALSRVLELEYEVYSKRPAVSAVSTQQPASVQEREAMLFTMMEHVLAAPETVEALEAVTPHALRDYENQLRLLEQQNQRRHILHEARALEQEQARNPLMQTPGALPHMTGDLFESTFGDELPEDVMNEQAEQHLKEQKELDRQNDDELAQTAANLLERVSDNQTSKFKNSAFLGLMRQLADREIRVEGDKMVPVSTAKLHQASQYALLGKNC